MAEAGRKEPGRKEAGRKGPGRKERGGEEGAGKGRGWGKREGGNKKGADTSRGPRPPPAKDGAEATRLTNESKSVLNPPGQTIEITNVYNPKFRQLCFSCPSYRFA